jgi:large subunit ribosomal protein L10
VPTPKKEIQVKSLVELFKTHKFQIITDHSGLDVAQISALRRELRKCGAEMLVAKNRLISIARAQAGLAPIDGVLNGPTSVVMSTNDPIAPAKVLRKFFVEAKKPAIKGIVFGDTFIEASKFDSIAEMPGFQELRAMVVGSLAAPITGLVYSLNGLLGGFVRALDAIRESKQAA